MNEWAGIARSHSEDLMGKEFEKKNGISNVGYALFIYLNNYSTFVKDGSSKIINSITQENSLEYLLNNCSEDELINIQENIALENFLQDYENKNLIVSPDYKTPLNIKESISLTPDNTTFSYDNINLYPLGLSYYLINDSSQTAFKIQLSTNSKYITAFIITETKGKFELIDSAKLANENYEFDTNNYENYEKLYIVISNSSPCSDEVYSLNIQNIRKVNDNEKKKNEYGSYFSIQLLDSKFFQKNENLEKEINTYFFDKNGKYLRHITTAFWNTEDTAKNIYENFNSLDQSEYGIFQNIQISENMIFIEWKSTNYENYTEDELINEITAKYENTNFNPYDYL